MKKILLITLLSALMIFTTVSQEKNMWLTGTLQLSGNAYNAQSESSFTLIPEFGYHIEGPWAVGGQVGFDTYRSSNGDTSRESRTVVAPFARHLFGAPGSMNFFAQAELPLNFYGGDQPSSTSVGFNLRPGLVYLFSESWGATMYMPPVFSFESHNDFTSFEFAINDGYTIQRYLLSVALGITYWF